MSTTAIANTNFTDFRVLVNSVSHLISARSQLGEDKGAAIDKLISLAEKLEISRYVQSNEFIAVAGMQGTGKTTILKCLYDLPQGLLDISTGRSEQIPVFITEDSSLPENTYRAEQVSINRETGKMSREEIDTQKVARYSKKIANVAFIELFVPAKYDAKFVLLPGFEKNENRDFDTVYNNVMEYTLYFAKAVMLVVDDVGMANQDIDVLISEKLGKNFSPANCVFAISKCDLKKEKERKELKNTLVSICEENGFKINPHQVVCTLGEADSSWHEELMDAIAGNIDYSASKKSYGYFRPMVEEMKNCAQMIKEELQQENISMILNDRPDIYSDLEAALDGVRSEIKKGLETACTAAQDEVVKTFKDRFDDIDGCHKRDKKFLVIKKSEREKLQDKAVIQKVAENCLYGNSKDKTETVFVQKLKSGIVNNQLTSGVQDNYLLATNSVISILGERELTETEQKEKQEKTMRAIASYFDNSVTYAEKCDLVQMSKVVATEFKMYYLGAITNTKNDYNSVCYPYDSIEDSIKRIQKKRSKHSVAKTVALIDMLDGSPDIIKSGVGLAELIGVSSAVPYIAAGVGIAALAATGVNIINSFIDSQNAVCVTWAHSLAGILEEQKNEYLDMYDNACQKLLDHVQRVHDLKCGVDERRIRLSNARYATEDILKLVAHFDEQYGESFAAEKGE